MVVRWTALAVDRFTIVSHDDVDLSVLGHGLQCAVHRGETDAVATVSDDIVNLLSRAELLLRIEGLGDRCSLPGLPTQGCLSHVNALPVTATAPRGGDDVDASFGQGRRRARPRERRQARAGRWWGRAARRA